MHSVRGESEPQPLAPPRWDWQSVNRVLVVRLRSIGDTVLSTSSLVALRRFLPNTKIDVLLEDWVAPVLEGLPQVDEVITFARGSLKSRAQVARRLRASRYDVVFNLHGGTTATFLTRATGARHRVGFETYQYAGLHNHLAPSPLLLWGRNQTHSVEQQLSLLGWTGIPVSDRPPTQLAVTEAAAAAVHGRLEPAGFANVPFAVIHPAAAFATKQWAAENFGQLAKELNGRGLGIVAIAGPTETQVIEELKQSTTAPVVAWTDLSLPEITALLARARLFIGNDSGIAHMAAAVKAPSVVIFGSSNRIHWRPWTTAAAEIVYEELECQPCPGYYCEKFEQPECIKRVPVDRVLASVDRVLRESL
jgi:predicted lipopolysaccharide heptosyltransferase III